MAERKCALQDADKRGSSERNTYQRPDHEDDADEDLLDFKLAVARSYPEADGSDGKQSAPQLGVS